MLLEDIRDEVQLIVNDATFTDAIVDGYISTVYQSVVGECMLPELKSLDVLETILGQAYTSMSGLTGGFSGVLSRVYTSEGLQLSIYPKLELLMDEKGNMTDEGSVEAVALEGSTLWYYPIPTTEESLTIIYYKNPTDLTADGDEPDCIPSFLHRQILVKGAAAMCFDTIEGGVEGLKVNTRSRELAKLEGVVKFREWLGKTRRHYISSQEPF